MPRMFNESVAGFKFSEETKRAVWNTAHIVSGYNPDFVRKDRCGAWIVWEKYGDTTANGNGWEIDHIRPVAEGGGDELDNLQPLQWQNNRAKCDDYPAYQIDYCVVPSKN